MSAALDFSENELTTEGSIGQDKRLTAFINHDMMKDDLSSRLNFDNTTYDKHDSASQRSPSYFSDFGEIWAEYQISSSAEFYSDIFMGTKTRSKTTLRNDYACVDFYTKEASARSDEDPQAISDDIMNKQDHAQHMRLVKIFWYGALIFILGICAVLIGFFLSIHNLFKFSFLLMLVGSGLSVISLFKAQESLHSDFTRL